MGTIYFLIFIGVCAVAVIWITRSTGSKKSLVRSNSAKEPYGKLTPTSHDRLSSKEEIWAARRKYANTNKSFSAPKRFVPKSVAAASPEYDGYSRRDRHHLVASGQVAEETRVDGPSDSPSGTKQV